MSIKWEERGSERGAGDEAARRYARESHRASKQNARRRTVQEIPMRFAELCRRRLEALHERGMLVADAGEAFSFSLGVDIRLKYGDDYLHVTALRFSVPDRLWKENIAVGARWAFHRVARALLGESAYFEKLWGQVSKTVARRDLEMSERFGRSAPGLVSFDEARQIEAVSLGSQESRRGLFRL